MVASAALLHLCIRGGALTCYWQLCYHVGCREEKPVSQGKWSVLKLCRSRVRASAASQSLKFPRKLRSLQLLFLSSGSAFLFPQLGLYVP